MKKQYGLIGKKLSHSYSKEYFTKKFDQLNLADSSYDLYELESIKQFNDLIAHTQNLTGLNVTIPYKQEVIAYLNELDPICEEIQAVNTIQISKRQNSIHLKGYNTDVIGFKESLKPFLAKQHQRALILGSGGASKAVAYVLKQMDIPYFMVSRNPDPIKSEISYTDLDSNAIASFKMIINTTPLGMYPEVDAMPAIDLSKIGADHLVYDLIYRPEETLLLQQAKAKGALCVNGMSMLKRQAEAAWRIWNT